MLYFGQGTELDKEEAKKWFTKSAGQGNKEAVRRLEALFGQVDLANYVDLGLPSGTLWADRNVGAKDIHDLGTLQGCDDISGLPTYDQAVELVECCDFYKETNGGKALWRVQGPNGNHVMFVEYDNDVCGMPAAICCCNGSGQGFRPFLMISTDNITVGITMVENLPARQVRDPHET